MMLNDDDGGDGEDIPHDFFDSDAFQLCLLFR
jgi:hypothetical protein